MIDYEVLEQEETFFAERLALWIKEVVQPQTVLDVGCGPGMHVYALRKLGVVAWGIDQDPRVDGKPFLKQVSLFDWKIPAELVLCMEVAEHIPEEFADEVAGDVSELTQKYLIWTAALPGQGGDGHINCQPKEYWEEKFIKLGMKRNPMMENALKHYVRQGYYMGWFVNNLLWFEWE
jgi:hypothetical protein